LPTYHCGNGSRDVAAWSVLEDGGGNLGCSSVSSGGSDGSGDSGWPFSKQQLNSGGLDLAGRWRELGWLWRLGFG
jgi:hypothetical protein